MPLSSRDQTQTQAVSSQARGNVRKKRAGGRFKTGTVRELIQKLQKLPPDADVAILLEEDLDRGRTMTSDKAELEAVEYFDAPDYDPQNECQVVWLIIKTDFVLA